MSEFSKSCRLSGTSPEDGIALLRSAGLAGFFFPDGDGWVALVAEGEAFGRTRPLIRANAGTLVHWIPAEDHGWEFAVYRRSRQGSAYACTWDGDCGSRVRSPFRNSRRTSAGRCRA